MKRKATGWLIDVHDGVLRNPKLSVDLTRGAAALGLALRPIPYEEKELKKPGDTLLAGLLAQRALLHREFPTLDFTLIASIPSDFGRRRVMCWRPEAKPTRTYRRWLETVPLF